MDLTDEEALAIRSPSSQRAWIEMYMAFPPWFWVVVALLAEGVDRNICASWS